MDLKLGDFFYDLPDAKIAKHPPVVRGSSKLLVYRKGEISHSSFQDIISQLPKDATIVLNDTKVIPARIILQKETGARIEVFLLEPIAPSNVHEEVMNAKGKCTWKCMIGNAKRFKLTTTIRNEDLDFEVTRVGEDLVEFSWNDQTFSELLLEIGKVPLPPYIHREVENEDKHRYQTVYSKMKGAVAAPTAGLHFTDEIMEELFVKGFDVEYVTLHVSAGTFQPIKSEQIKEHPMHNEQIWVNKQTIQSLHNTSKTIAVGTTSMRTLESLYWFGVRLENGMEDFYVKKDDPYNLTVIPKKKAIQNVLDYMQKKGIELLAGQTEIFLYPGYTFHMCNGLITNYHLPNSTLILLIAAFIGEDWRKVYKQALENDYKFLSYGDSSLLLP